VFALNKGRRRGQSRFDVDDVGARVVTKFRIYFAKFLDLTNVTSAAVAVLLPHEPAPLPHRLLVQALQEFQT
jgi:hypothetical protein